MPKLSDLKTADLLKVFVMGEPGTGKTVGASSFPGPIKFFDFDGKISSAYSFWKKRDPSRLEQIDYEDCTPKDEKGTSFLEMNRTLGEIKKEFQETGKLAYKTLVIDSMTTMSQEMLNWLVHYETGIKRSRDIKSRKVPGMQDYMIFLPTFREFINLILTLPWNVVCTGHITVDKDELTGEIHRSAAIPGKMSKQLPIYFEEVYVSFAKDGKYVVQTQADYKYPCRSQLQGVPKEIPFVYSELEKYI